MAEVYLEESNFEVVKEYWSHFLWPDRKSAIEETSWIDQDGKINPQLQFAKTYFWCLKLKDSSKVVGVVSGADAGSLGFRSRGLWVDEDYRNQGFGRALMLALMQKAAELGHKKVWTMPRESSVHFYESIGFKMQKNIEGYEYGPHYIAECKLKD